MERLRVLRFASTAAAVLTVALAGCGGGGGHDVPVPTGPSRGPAASLKIVIDAAPVAGASAKRRPRYVSPATQSVAISFVPTAGPTQTFNQNLTTANNPNCHASLVSPTICTITITVAPGSYAANFATYDGALDGNGTPTGAVLSANQSVPVTVVQGQNNALNVTFEGVPASVAFVPDPSALVSGSMVNGFSYAACLVPQRVTVVPRDADGNYILGPGAPVPSLTGGASTYTIASPTLSAPNTFTVGVSLGPRVGQTLTATVTPGLESGAPAVSASVPLAYASCSNTKYPLAISSNEIVAGKDDALWFTDRGSNHIGRITTAGAITVYTLPGNVAALGGIAAGPDGALWFAAETDPAIGRITTDGAFSRFALPPSADPKWITSGPDGALWFTDQGTNSIGRITTSGALTEYPVPASVPALTEIVTGPDGALWFGEASNIGRITTSGTITEYPVTTDAMVTGIVAGPDGALWFAETTAGKIGRITTAGAVSEFSTPNSSPYGIVAAPDGALWFTDQGTSGIGQITTAGAIVAHLLPGTDLMGLAIGKDGGIWYTNNTTIGHLQ